MRYALALALALAGIAACEDTRPAEPLRPIFLIYVKTPPGSALEFSRARGDLQFAIISYSAIVGRTFADGEFREFDIPANTYGQMALAPWPLDARACFISSSTIIGVRYWTGEANDGR